VAKESVSDQKLGWTMKRFTAPQTPGPQSSLEVLQSNPRDLDIQARVVRTTQRVPSEARRQRMGKLGKHEEQ